MRLLKGSFLVLVCSLTALGADESSVRFGKAAALGLSFIDYEQPDALKTSQTWVNLKLYGSLVLSETLSFGTKMSVGLIPIRKKGMDAALRNVEGAGGLSYYFWDAENMGAFASLGYQVQTMLNNEDFGFKGLKGPWGQVAYRSQIRPFRLFELGAAFGFFPASQTLTGSSTETSVRMAYIWNNSEQSSTSWAWELEYKIYNLQLAAGPGKASIFSLNLSATL